MIYKIRGYNKDNEPELVEIEARTHLEARKKAAETLTRPMVLPYNWVDKKLQGWVERAMRAETLLSKLEWCARDSTQIPMCPICTGYAKHTQIIDGISTPVDALHTAGCELEAVLTLTKEEW